MQRKPEPDPAKTPRFEGLEATSDAASRTMRGNQARDTSPELALRRALWRRGLRYRLHAADLPGKPDLVFRRKRVAVFCDGDFWHGRDWEARRRRLEAGSNPGYWVAKITSNRERDARHNAALGELGWSVIRIWEGDIKADPEQAATVVEHTLATVLTR